MLFIIACSVFMTTSVRSESDLTVIGQNFSCKHCWPVSVDHNNGSGLWRLLNLEPTNNVFLFDKKYTVKFEFRIVTFSDAAENYRPAASLWSLISKQKGKEFFERWKFSTIPLLLLILSWKLDATRSHRWWALKSEYRLCRRRQCLFSDYYLFSLADLHRLGGVYDQRGNAGVAISHRRQEHVSGKK